ncbi:NAD(P)/FAD-dependent oxidoreductase [Dictyobacter formicarum]|uniref:Halogenase n=1 Tax=Dictyobacter formicarum TaxID=2778368 RepID=A0ABQ3VTB1_9CHLR|nr:tryptophan 7-halogenase [Dictyobacter formicarum]GHO89517.1 halogenase [Dictyobacter formicarum]
MSSLSHHITPADTKTPLLQPGELSEQDTPETASHYDVAILGGGLAGLTLALQIKKSRPASNVIVIEKQKYPVPEAAYKVGESSVEIASHYLRDILGLEEHLQTQQLRKFGLRMFFSFEDNRDITRRVELGPAAPVVLHTYQLDRGRLENMLSQEIQAHGVTFLDGHKVEQVTLHSDAHSLCVSQDGEERNITASWVVDASGRSSLLKRPLGLTKKVEHDSGSVWFRIGQEIDINQWSDSPEWHSRIIQGDRSLSTIHLCGTGYWVWIIRLASGSTSIGIVADPKVHPFDSMNRFDRALAWLHKHEPQFAEVIERGQEDIQDFRVMKHYAYSSEQVFSSNRWCLTGEAGVFADPLYSPGSDFIAISNGFICDLIARDLNGEDIRERSTIYNRVFLRFTDAWLGIYDKQYGLLGNAQVMVTKITWDTGLYWAINSLLYFQGKWTALGYNRKLTTHLNRIFLLTSRIQAFFREWAAIDQALQQPELSDAFADYYNPLDFMKKLHIGMAADLTDAEMDAQFVANVQLLERLAGKLVSTVIEKYSSHADNETCTQQLHAWKDDASLTRLINIYQQSEASEAIDPSWPLLIQQAEQVKQ